MAVKGELERWVQILSVFPISIFPRMGRAVGSKGLQMINISNLPDLTIADVQGE